MRGRPAALVAREGYRGVDRGVRDDVEGYKGSGCDTGVKD